MKKLLLALLLAVFLPITAFALDFTAEIVDLDGPVTVTPKATGKPVPAKKGMKLSPGDVIETKSGAEAELLYDDGNVTRLDEETTLAISRLSVEDDKSRQTVLDLAVGRVKNSVSKLASQKSKFEVHTKTAVAGVTGTPPWTVGAFGRPGGQQKVEVDLMPNGNGAATKGVFVRGTDAGATTVNLSPGMRTTALPGAPPVSPIPISPARLQQLQTSMPITTTPEVQLEKKQELEKKIEKEVKSEEKSSSEEKKEEKKEEAKKEDEKKEEMKEEATQEEEKKTEEAKKEETAEEKKEEPKKEAKKEEPKQEAKKEEPKQEPSKEDAPKKAATPAKETASLDTKIEAPVIIGGTGGDTSTTKTADAPPPPPPPAPIRTSSASMMEHISNNVSVGSVGAGTQVSDTGDEIGAASLSGANQNAVPAATRVRVMVNIVNK